MRSSGCCGPTAPISVSVPMASGFACVMPKMWAWGDSFTCAVFPSAVVTDRLWPFTSASWPCSRDGAVSSATAVSAASATANPAPTGTEPSHSRMIAPP